MIKFMFAEPVGSELYLRCVLIKDVSVRAEINKHFGSVVINTGELFNFLNRRKDE